MEDGGLINPNDGPDAAMAMGSFARGRRQAEDPAEEQESLGRCSVRCNAALCSLHCAAAAAGLAIRSRPGAVWLFCIVVPYSAPFSSRHQGFADCMKRGRSLQPICWWQATRTASEPTPADGSRTTVYYSQEVGLLLPVHHNQRSVMAGIQTIIMPCLGLDRRSVPSRVEDGTL
jgi:hypothetical protein